MSKIVRIFAALTDKTKCIMNEKEKKAQEYADGIAQFGVQNQYCKDDFKAGWDACCKYLYELPLDEIVEYLCEMSKSK